MTKREKDQLHFLTTQTLLGPTQIAAFVNCTTRYAAEYIRQHRYTTNPTPHHAPSPKRKHSWHSSNHRS